MDLNLREEAVSHGSAPTNASLGDAARASPQLSDDQSRSRADDQRARGYVLPLGEAMPHQQAPEVSAPDLWRSSSMPPHPQFAGMPSTSSYPPSQEAATIKPEPPPEQPVAPAPVPLQPRPAAYSPFGGSGLGSSGSMSIPPRPPSMASSHGKARSNSWSYPASAVSPYAYPFPTSAAAGGMPAPAGARASQRYRYRGLSLSDDDVRQQQLQPGPFLSAQQQQQPQQPMQQQQQMDRFPYGGGDQAAAGFFQSSAGQASGTGPPTPPLPTTPSSFIRRTSLPQTYLHTIPIARPSPIMMSNFAALPTDAASTFPTGVPPGPPRQEEEKLEIPTHGTRALPKEIASHPAIQSITKTHTDQPTAEAEEGEKEHGTEASPEEDSGGALAPGAMHAGEGKFVDITEYLNLPQSKVAKTLGIPSSTLSKRWKEAARARKWPWRTVCKIDKEIIALLHNISPAVTAKGPEHVPPEIHSRLLTLLKQRQDELKPVIIRL